MIIEKIDDKQLLVTDDSGMNSYVVDLEWLRTETLRRSIDTIERLLNSVKDNQDWSFEGVLKWQT